MTKGDKNLFTIVLCGLIFYFLLYPRMFRVLSTTIVGRILLVSAVIITTNVHLYLGLGLLLVIFYLYKDPMLEGFESTYPLLYSKDQTQSLQDAYSFKTIVENPDKKSFDYTDSFPNEKKITGSIPPKSNSKTISDLIHIQNVVSPKQSGTNLP